MHANEVPWLNSVSFRLLVPPVSVCTPLTLVSDRSDWKEQRSLSCFLYVDCVCVGLQGGAAQTGPDKLIQSASLHSNAFACCPWPEPITVHWWKPDSQLYLEKHKQLTQKKTPCKHNFKFRNEEVRSDITILLTRRAAAGQCHFINSWVRTTKLEYQFSPL